MWIPTVVQETEYNIDLDPDVDQHALVFSKDDNLVLCGLVSACTICDVYFGLFAYIQILAAFITLFNLQLKKDNSFFE